jgi:uncharacterized membrane protein YheB (UPF0754 family)
MGFVGYFTNYIAIKMLFRPHRKKWYSFGWQGVIPKNRKKLAIEMGNMVGGHLISDKAVKSAILEEKFQIILENTLEQELKNYLSRDWGSIYSILTNMGIDSGLLLQRLSENLTNNKELLESINNAIENFLINALRNIGKKSLADYESLYETISQLLSKIITEGIVNNELIDEISTNLGNKILSGKSLAEIIQFNTDEFIEKISAALTEKLIEFIYRSLNNQETKDMIAKKIIDFKNNYFGKGFFDQLKLTALNIMFTSETIYEIIDREFPEMIAAIRDNDEIKDKIKDALKGYFSRIMHTPLYVFVEKMGFEKFYEIRANYTYKAKEYIKSEKFYKKINEIISFNLNSFKDKPLSSVLKSYNIDLDANINIHINLVNFLKQENQTSLLKESLLKIMENINITNLYNNISEKTFKEIIKTMRDELNIVLDKHIVDAFKAINVSSIITQKINDLELSQLENLLFSFMRDEFRWINILGFILGFIFGLIEAIILVCV